MPDVDLSNYAGSLVFGILVIGTFLAFLGYKLHGSIGAGVSIFLTIVGMFVSLGIVNTMKFEDASMETVLTIPICTLLPPTIYSIYLISKWAENKRNDKLRQKIYNCQQELSELEKQLNHRNALLNFITLIKSCDGDMTDVEQRVELLNAKNITDAIKNKKNKIQRLSSEIQYGGRIE